MDDRTIARLARTGSSIPQELQRDDAQLLVTPDQGMRPWERVQALRARAVAPPLPDPPVQGTRAENGTMPVNRSLRQLLMTGTSAPPSARAGSGRDGTSEAPPRRAGGVDGSSSWPLSASRSQEDPGAPGPDGRVPQGDYGPWAGAAETTLTPIGIDTVMGRGI
jgi:hypothetical protein